MNLTAVSRAIFRSQASHPDRPESDNVGHRYARASTPNTSPSFQWLTGKRGLGGPKKFFAYYCPETNSVSPKARRGLDKAGVVQIMASQKREDADRKRK